MLHLLLPISSLIVRLLHFELLNLIDLHIFLVLFLLLLVLYFVGFLLLILLILLVVIFEEIVELLG